MVAKYSDRLLNSDKKSNKVERASSRNYPGSINLDQYMRQGQEISKRPSVQNSIPRTEKVQPRPLIVQQKHSVPADIEEMRRRIVKKCRVLSNNHPKPSWWG